ncbi:hypothetical protein OROGR_029010 [Orobanche gracilis]
MSAAVCGKRPFFEDTDAAMPPAYKRFRCSSWTSPTRFTYSPPLQSSLVDQLRALFPYTEIQLLEKALEEFSNDLDLASKTLYELCSENCKGNSGSTTEENATMDNGSKSTLGDSAPFPDRRAQNNMSADGAEWVDLIVKEIVSATSIDDMSSRAASVLQSLEKSISSRANAEVAHSFHKENLAVKEQIEVLLRENIILKRAVSIQHERQKENDAQNQEVEQLKQLVARQQEQLRTLEVGEELCFGVAFASG